MQYGQTALHVASEKGFVEIVETLLENTASIDKEDKVRPL